MALREQTAIAAVLSNMDAELAGLERLVKTRALKQGMIAVAAPVEPGRPLPGQEEVPPVETSEEEARAEEQGAGEVQVSRVPGGSKAPAAPGRRTSSRVRAF